MKALNQIVAETIKSLSPFKRPPEDMISLNLSQNLSQNFSKENSTLSSKVTKKNILVVDQLKETAKVLDTSVEDAKVEMNNLFVKDKEEAESIGSTSNNEEDVLRHTNDSKSLEMFYQEMLKLNSNQVIMDEKLQTLMQELGDMSSLISTLSEKFLQYSSSFSILLFIEIFSKLSLDLDLKDPLLRKED